MTEQRILRLQTLLPLERHKSMSKQGSLASPKPLNPKPTTKQPGITLQEVLPVGIGLCLANHLRFLYMIFFVLKLALTCVSD